MEGRAPPPKAEHYAAWDTANLKKYWGTPVTKSFPKFVAFVTATFSVLLAAHTYWNRNNDYVLHFIKVPTKEEFQRRYYLFLKAAGYRRIEAFNLPMDFGFHDMMPDPKNEQNTSRPDMDFDDRIFIKPDLRIRDDNILATLKLPPAVPKPFVDEE